MEQLLVGASFALTELSFHTAEPVRKVYNCDGSQTSFELPKDSIDYYNKTASVQYLNGGRKTYLSNAEIPRNAIVESGHTSNDWIEWPQGTLKINFVPATGSQIVVDYFRQWEEPIDDNSLINIPSWMETPFCYLVAAIALESVGMQFSSINQWKRRLDSGDPIDNPILEQVRHYVGNAQRIMLKMPPQERDRWYLNE